MLPAVVAGSGVLLGAALGTTSSAAATVRVDRSPLAAAAPCGPASRGDHTVAPGPGRTVALTFDDGPGPSTTAVLDILAAHHVPATFFNLGINAQTYPALVRREVSDGYAMGDHTWDHPVLSLLTGAEQQAQMRRAGAEQAGIVGSRPCLFRPPYGDYDTATLADSFSDGMTMWNWSVDTEDWKAQGSDSSYWVHRIISRAEAGSSQPHPVILMHNQATADPATVAALGPVISYYQHRGYRFVDLYGRTAMRPEPAGADIGGRLHVFARLGDGALHERVRSGSRWSGWRRSAGAGLGAPAAATLADGTVLLATRAASGQVLVRFVGPALPGDWTSIGGTAATRPAVAVSRSGRVSVVVRGMDDTAWMRERVGGRWRPWRSLGGHLISAPAAAATGDQNLTVVGVDTAGRLVERRRLGTVWGRWFAIGGTATGDPSLQATADGQGVLLAARTPSGGVRIRLHSGATGWGSWHTVTASLASSPALVVDGSVVRLFGFRTDGALVQDVGSSAPSGWRGWRRIRS